MVVSKKLTNMPFRWLHLMIVFVLCIPADLQGQDLSLRKVTVVDGLTNNFVHAIHQDAFGYIWFGTLQGLDRYDGVEVRSFTGRFNQEKQPTVKCMLNDPVQGLWIGTDRGLFYWNYIAPEFLLVPLQKDHEQITSLLVLPGDSLLLVGTAEGLFTLNTESNVATPVNDASGEPILAVKKAVIDDQGIVWAAALGALRAIDLHDMSVTAYTNPGSSPSFNNFSSLAYVNDQIVVGTYTQGLFVFDRHIKRFTRALSVGSNYILSLTSDKAGHLYVGTDGYGMVVMDKSNKVRSHYIQNPSNSQSLSSNAVYSVFVQENGRVWLGTHTGGVNFSSSMQNLFHVVAFNNNFIQANQSMRSVFFDSSKNKYLGTRDGLYILEADGQTHFFNDQNSEIVASNVILSIGEVKNEVYVGVFREGVFKLEKTGNTYTLIKDNRFPVRGTFYSFSKDRNGNMWAGGLEGLYRIDQHTGEVINYTTYNSPLTDRRILAMHFDTENRLWTGSIGGGTSVYTIDGDQLKPVDLGFDLSGNKAVSFFEDSRKNIWIASEGAGLCVVDATLDQMECYSTADGLPGNSVTAITEAPKDVFWISTLKGFGRLNLASQRFQNYTLSDGLPGLVFNRNAVFNQYDEAGLVWFGNERGLLRFNPDSISQRSKYGKVMLTDFYLSGMIVEPREGTFLNKPVSDIEQIILKGKQSSLGFRFVALNYKNPGDNQYNYRLLGNDSNWLQTDKNIVSFADLKPGNYQFQVCLSDAGLPGSEHILSTNIVIKPYFYQTAGFWVLMGLMLTGITGLVIMSVGRLRNKLKNLQKRTIAQKKARKYESSQLSPERSLELKLKIKEYVEKTRAFENPDLKLSDLASSLDCSVHHISQVINLEMKQSFYEFINTYRVEAVKTKMQDPVNEKYTLPAIAENCGFSSKTSFYRAFKKLTGQTPLEYQVSVKQKNNPEFFA